MQDKNKNATMKATNPKPPVRRQRANVNAFEKNSVSNKKYAIEIAKNKFVDPAPKDELEKIE